jgi:squalene-hopene/tetraprenyl-beta-curcumene cyclase
VLPATGAATDGSADDVDGPEDDAEGAQAALRRTLRRSARHLLSLQDDAGWWKGDLESNTTIDAQDLLLREYLGVTNPEFSAATARFIRSRQNPDGSWSNYHGGPGDLSTSVESYIALKLAGHDPAAAHMTASAEWIRGRGGVPAARTFTRIWLAMFGWWRWEDLPVLPPEILFLPRRAPLSIYTFGSWARQTIVALTVVLTHRPVRPAPFPIDELFPAADDPAAATAADDRSRGRGLRRDRSAPDQQRSAPDQQEAHGDQRAHGGPGGLGGRLAGRIRGEVSDRISWKRFFEGLDAALHVYHRHPIRPLRALALSMAERWIIVRQEADGCFGGIQPPTVYGIVALRLLGYPVEHPTIQAALRSLEDYSVIRPDGSRMIEASQSPVWDTCLAVIALADAGVPTDDPALVRATDWLLGQEIAEHRGDWSIPHPELAAGGWAFEFENDTYPDTDDTAEVLLSLQRVTHPHPERIRAATDRGVAWLLGLQSSDGGWGAYDTDNDSQLVYKIPFADFGLLTDPPSADVTAHVVEILAEVGLADDPRTRRGVEWLLRAQEADGSWFGRWGVNYVYGTGGVLPALRAAGLPADHPAITRAAAWLVAHQNPDGGWGEDLVSYDDPSTAGRGTSTASQTAWALLGLIAADRLDEAAAAGVAWLAQTQNAEGSWDEDEYTGTGFPGYFYINYNLYRLVWPVMALGRYQQALDARQGLAPRHRGLTVWSG